MRLGLLHHHHHGSQLHERHAARTHPESVVLDLGGDIGALILYTDPAMLGVEVEISACEEDDRRSHKEVLERQINGHPVYSAVFDNVRAGRHTLWLDDKARERNVVVTGGVVAEVDWREKPVRAAAKD
jgi:hypothetical protein